MEKNKIKSHFQLTLKFNRINNSINANFNVKKTLKTIRNIRQISTIKNKDIT